MTGENNRRQPENRDSANSALEHQPRVFLVDTWDWFISISVYMVASLFGLALFYLGFRYIKTGFSYQKTFQHLTPLELLGLLATLGVLLVAVAYLLSLFLKRATITLQAGTIRGVNYWGIRKEIPIDDISGFSWFSNNGVEAIVVESREHGKVYISTKTERLPELLLLLAHDLPELAETLSQYNSA